ncbi:hypothetical protein [Streptomyces sp. NK08204]|uniref:Rv1733c family protein n=1 Tax=Streptomyces sp. NK08204 TaxID=2873260 RepID=UPI001CEC0987|nr:hypothetical protein [Streptomyces sp. NK08204]
MVALGRTGMGWRNPMRRRSDVVEGWIGLVAALVIATMGPLVGMLAAGHCEAVLARQAHDRRPTVAVLTRDATVAANGDPSGVPFSRVSAPVRWTAADGAVHTGRASVDEGKRAGSTTRVWTDGRGRMTSAPLGRAAAAADAGVYGASAAAGVCLVVLAGRCCAVAWLDRSRGRAWEKEWAAVEPGWSHRRV